jgi:hypothetical protein
MKRLLLICLVVFMGCATSTFHKDYFRPDGTKEASVDATMKRPIFAAMAQSWTETTGKMSSSTSFKADQFMDTLMEAYTKYMSGGLASTPAQTPSVTLVPKAEAQATPPPAEIVK